MRIILFLIAVLFMLGCQSNWNSRVGNYTYGDALKEHGPPQQSDIFKNGNRVYKWTLSTGISWVDKLSLVFDRKGLLIFGQEKRHLKSLNPQTIQESIKNL